MLGQLNLGSSANTDESANGLIALNAMLDSWANEELMCYAIQDESIPLAAGNSTRTMGPTGDLVTTRPSEIRDAYIVYASNSIPVDVIEADKYAMIGDKAAQAQYPARLYYQPSMPNGTLYLHPVPNGASTLHVLTETPIAAFATLGVTVTLPPGWEKALSSNLAIDLAPECEKEPSPTVVGMARNSKAMIKRTNTRPKRATTELAKLFGNRGFNIITGP